MCLVFVFTSIYLTCVPFGSGAIMIALESEIVELQPEVADVEVEI